MASREHWTKVRHFLLLHLLERKTLKARNSSTPVLLFIFLLFLSPLLFPDLCPLKTDQHMTKSSLNACWTLSVILWRYTGRILYECSVCRMAKESLGKEYNTHKDRAHFILPISYPGTLDKIWMNRRGLSEINWKVPLSDLHWHSQDPPYLLSNQEAGKWASQSWSLETANSWTFALSQEVFSLVFEYLFFCSLKTLEVFQLLHSYV